MTQSAPVCPYCSLTLDVPETVTWHRCERCGRLVNASAQRAYWRAQCHYAFAQEAELTPLSPKRPYVQRNLKDAMGLEAFQQAHSALELAFQADLPEEARSEGIAVMAEITQILSKRQMLSPLEASYWVKVLIERNALQEQSEIDARLSPPARGNPLQRLRWRLRRRQLRNGLLKLRHEISDLEETIAFVEVPHARRAMGSPTR